MLAAQTNVTECDSVVVSTKIWTLRLQSASYNKGRESVGYYANALITDSVLAH